MGRWIRLVFKLVTVVFFGFLFRVDDFFFELFSVFLF